jgi:hypothetical protein
MQQTGKYLPLPEINVFVFVIAYSPIIWTNDLYTKPSLVGSLALHKRQAAFLTHSLPIDFSK